jgi:hypothetical protein
MTSVHLVTTEPEPNDGKRWRLGAYDFLTQSAISATRHSLTADAESADIILFSDCGPGPYYSSLTRSPLFKKYWEKCFLFDHQDKPLCLLPGVYASIENQWYDPRWVRSGFYAHIDGYERFSHQPWQQERQYLFSFVGSVWTAPVREALTHLNHARFYLSDSSAQAIPAYSTGDTETVEHLRKTYSDAVRQSSFVLCPRGVGCSSQRLFEVMCMGRAPVILADEWVRPVGPDWDAFSITVPEADVLKLPDILAAHESSAEEMGTLARREWERWYSPEVLFETVVNWCLDIRSEGKCQDKWYRRRKYLQFLRPFHTRNLLRGIKNSIKARS